MRLIHGGVLVPIAALMACQGRPAPPPAEGSSPSAPAHATASAPARSAPPSAPAVPADVPSAVPGANVTMERLEVDGLEASQLSCKSGGGLLAGAGIVGALAKERERLAGCAPARTEVRVHFAFADGKVSDVKVAGAANDGVARCVADALAAATPPSAGACTLALILGPKAP